MTAVASSTASQVTLSGYGATTSAGAVALGNTLDLLGPAAMDAMSRLYVMSARTSELSATNHRDRVEDAARDKQAALQRAVDDLRNAMQSRKDAGFWDCIKDALGKIAKVVGIAAAVAITVVSLGTSAVAAGLAIAALVLSLAATAQNETHFLQTLGVSDKVANVLSIGMAVAAAVCSLGAGAVASGAAVASSAAEAANTGVRVATVAAGAAEVGAGACGIAGAECRREASGFETDAFVSDQQAQALQRAILAAIADLEDALNGESDNTERIVQAIGEQGGAQLAAAGGTQA